ncbi:MAG: hypothetical protein NC311_14750, partial [Muribaculaceae bacterium]|nr:hypothetical protein [Muribaculaceae bacterium]
MYLLSAAKVFPESTLLQDQAARRFCGKSSFARHAKRIFRKNLVASGFRTFRAPETDSIRTGSAKAYKKKSKVMRSTEKNKRK